MGFIFRFLPGFLLIYYLVPIKYKNPVLLMGSIIFYALGEPYYIFLLLTSVVMNYLGGLRMEAFAEQTSKRKGIMVLLLCLNIGPLLLFKFTGLPMPLGMSFFTFTALSYVLDVYLGRTKAETSIIQAGVYMMMFPKLISGPIAAYSEMKHEIEKRTIRAIDIEDGVVLFIIGLSFKTILANHFGMLWHDIQSVGFDCISTPLAWIGVVGYSAQLFFDFQGYSLMAMGLGRMLGFHLPLNFRHPYRAKTVGEYYRRWHITLGEWFKNYLYIPLGGNRKGTKRTYLNLLIVWMVTGIWHGVTWNFLIWGLALFAFILCEKIWLGKILKRITVLARVYVCFVIPLTWTVFAIDNLKDLGLYFTRLFPFWGAASYVNHTDYLRYLQNYTVFFGIALVVSLPFADKIYKNYHRHLLFKGAMFVLFWICVYQLANGLNNPFLYFRF